MILAHLRQQNFCNNWKKDMTFDTDLVDCMLNTFWASNDVCDSGIMHISLNNICSSFGISIFHMPVNNWNHLSILVCEAWNKLNLCQILHPSSQYWRSYVVWKEQVSFSYRCRLSFMNLDLTEGNLHTVKTL